MDLRGVLRPVGPLPARVYWLRRLLPLVIVALLVAAIAISCSGGSKSASGAAATTGKSQPSQPSSAATTSASPTASATPTGTPPCHAVDLGVVAGTDAGSYGSGTTPVLKVTVRNQGAAACVLTQSPSRRSWTIVSGSDRIWSTVGCPTSTVAIATPLQPGESVVHTVVWNRHRNGAHCATSAAKAAPGTYQLSVVVDGVRSAPAVFQITG